MAGPYCYDPRPFYYYDPGPFYYCEPRPFYSPAELCKPKVECEKKDGKGKDGEKKENDEKPKILTVEIRAHLCCDSCANKVEKKVRDMEGVDMVDCCQYTGKVTVRGDVKPDHVLKRVRKVKRDAELWPKKKQT